MTKEKIYTIWCGEYSDRTMLAVFRSKEKAEKYVEVQDKLSRGLYDNHYIVEYSFSDDGFDINTEVSKMYYCTIYIKDYYSTDGETLFNKKGDIDTDAIWDELMQDFQIESYDDLKPENYGKDMDIDKLEEEYGCTVEYMVCPNEVYIDKSDELWHSSYITVYSKRSYAHARKVAIEQYQITTQQELENGEL